MPDEAVKATPQLEGCTTHSPSTVSPETSAPAPFVDVPGYEILQELGRGGMGVVYRARQVQLNRLVALKMVLAGEFASEKQRLRFLIEAEMAARVRHPNIAQVYEVGTFQERPYFAMEYVAGVSLKDKLTGQPLPPREVAHLVATLAEAVQAAHAQGIIHRDLKPANVLLDADGTPKIIDFGLAKQTVDSAGLTASGALVGTPRYMSPEQAAGDLKRQGPLVDVWSLGVILYQLLTAHLPFEGDTALDTLDRVRTEPPLPTRRFAPNLPFDLEVICLKCLEKEPERRYVSAQALADDLHAFLEDRPISARPAGRFEKSWRWCRRNRARATAIAAVALLVLTLAVGGPLAALREADLRQRAENEETKAKEAADAEHLAKKEVEKRLAQIAKHNDLLASIFHDLDPKAEEKGGPSLRVQLGQRLDRATAELEEEAVGDPLAVAGLQYTLGLTQCELGNLDQALALLTKARATREARLGANHPDTLRATHNLASIYREAGRAADAIPLLEQVRDQWLKQLGPADPDTLSTLHELAFAYKAAGRTADAIALYEQVRDQRINVLGPDNPETLNTLNNLANSYRETGRTADAIRVFEQVRDLKVKNLGPEHPDTLITLQNLALAYRDAGRTADAIPLLEQVRDQQVKKIGPDHPDTLRTTLSLANSYRLAGRKPEAIALLEPLRVQAATKLGADHPITLATINNLAVTYQDVGRVADAVPLLEQLREQATKKLGADHPNVLSTINNLATAYQVAGRSSDAIPLFEEMRDRMLKKLGPDHPTTLATCRNLAIAYQSANRVAEAVPLFEEAVRRAKARTGAAPANLPSLLADLGRAYLLTNDYAKAEPTLRECVDLEEKMRLDDWTTANAKSMLGEALAGQKKYADAEPLLLAGYAGLKAKKKDIAPEGKNNLHDAAQRLVKLYDAWGKPDEARKWKNVLNELQQAAPRTGNADKKP